MTTSDRPGVAVVFDLDDTLYEEAQYVRSGKRAIAASIWRLYDVDVTRLLEDAEGDFLQSVCDHLALPTSVKQSLLWTYRLHQPELTRRPGVTELWQLLRANRVGIAVLTDGRSVTQRLKLKALGLSPDCLAISEEVGAEKPSPLGYQHIMSECPARAYCYIADNPLKDFIAARALGWKTIGLRTATGSIHQHAWEGAANLVHPDVWLSDFNAVANELKTWLESHELSLQR